MRRTALAIFSPMLLVALLAGCGSSSKTSSTTSSSAAAAPTPTSSSAASASTPSATPVVLITTKHAKVGTILATGQKKLTVYLFESDKGATSTCSGRCAVVWPPVIGKPKALGGAAAADLGTITRSDGKTQVTYKGHPLYLFVKDKDDGDTYGQGLHNFGAGWYVLRPSGSKIDNS